jgi:hypothetical protein
VVCKVSGGCCCGKDDPQWSLQRCEAAVTVVVENLSGCCYCCVGEGDAVMVPSSVVGYCARFMGCGLD